MSNSWVRKIDVSCGSCSKAMPTSCKAPPTARAREPQVPEAFRFMFHEKSLPQHGPRFLALLPCFCNQNTLAVSTQMMRLYTYPLIFFGGNGFGTSIPLHCHLGGPRDLDFDLGPPLPESGFPADGEDGTGGPLPEGGLGLYSFDSKGIVTSYIYVSNVNA